MYAVANNVQGTIQNALLIGGATTVTVDAATDAKLNALNTYPLFLSMWNANTQPNDTGNSMEIVRVTARSSPNNYTIVRGQQGTSATQHVLGDNISLLWTKGNADDKLNQDGSTIYATDTGAANAYVITLSSIPLQYTKGMTLTFIPTHNNTTASTLNVNGLGAKNITKAGGNALDPADLVNGIPVSLVYDGTQFQITTPDTRRNNYGATTVPGTGNDNTQGYQIGSVWINTSTGLVYVCTNASTGVAVWNTPSVKFGGTGADGALAISSGTTTLNLGGAAVFIKNYTSISITGTAGLAFSNPAAGGTIIILKSLGNVTITSSATPAIDLRLMGGAGGTGGASGGSTGSASSGGGGAAASGGGGQSGNTGSASAGSAGNAGTGYGIWEFFGPQTGGAGAVTTGSPSGIGGTQTVYGIAASALYIKLYVIPGAGGGGGQGSVNGNGTAGGRGGAALWMECAGAFNFTTGSIDASGAAGTNAAIQVGVGGGGGGGSIVILYGTLTANSGTISVAGGAGGTGTGGAGGGAGAGGITLVAANTEFA